MPSILGRIDPDTAAAVCAAIAALAACGALAAARRRLAGTTLIAPWTWTLLALLTVAGTEASLAVAGLSADGRSHYRYLAAAATFCPTMAVLGAKRPQDRGWQFIVATLWLVLAWPGISGLLLHPAGDLQLHAAWQWFLLLLWAIGLSNGLPTRHWAAATIGCAGQLILIAGWLPSLVAGWLLRLMPAADVRTTLGLALFAAGIAWWGFRRRTSRAVGFDRVWLDFRDAYGAVWGLRVRDRFNATADLCRWKMRLGWKGRLAESDSAPDAETSAAARRSLEQLLRRFVSPGWLAERWGDAESSLSQSRGETGHAAAAAGDYTEGT